MTDKMDDEHESGSSQNLWTHLSGNSDEAQPLNEDKSSGFSSSSDTISLEFSSLLKSGKIAIGSQGPLSSHEVSPNNSVVDMQNKSASQSPPILMTGKPAGYDPNRIPASIFASKPATPAEWSIASNESLFSIQMGNSSFSRDHVILLNKSQELAKYDHVILINKSRELLNKSRELPKSDEASNFPSSLPTVAEALDMERKSESSGKGSVATEASETAELAVREKAEDHDKAKMLPAVALNNSIRISNVSDGSGSTRSFAFPILGREGGRNVSAKVTQVKQQSLPRNVNSAVTKWFCCFPCSPSH